MPVPLPGNGSGISSKKSSVSVPGYGEAISALARVYQDSGQAAKATELLTKAATDNPKDGKVQFNLGVFRDGRIEFVEDFPAFDRNGDGKDPERNKGAILAAEASRLAALLVGQMLPAFSLLAPCDPGASAPDYITAIVKRSN